MGEFELIQRYFRPLSHNRGSEALVLGIGDDCAVQRIPQGRDLVFSIDTMVEGVHFPTRYAPEKLAWRALAAATSDLAAMGANPVCFTLALTLPEPGEPWLDAFAKGLATASKAFGIALAGGDTTRGALSLSIQVHGTVPCGEAITRSGAQGGDLVCVSGTLGDAAGALRYLDSEIGGSDVSALLDRYHHPVPRLELGEALIGVASAAIDVSDGLIADLGHILASSEVGAEVDVYRLPLSSALKRLAGERALEFALHGGDDYELCVTLPPGKWDGLDESVRSALTVIGRIEERAGLRASGTGQQELVNLSGFDHFRSVK